MKFKDTPRFTPKWFLTLPWTAQDIYKRLSPRDGAMREMQYWFFGDLPRTPIELALPRAAESKFSMLNAGRRQPGTSTTIFELSCILMGMFEAKTKNAIEIGTFNGNTTLNIAHNLPAGGKVVTLDLPIEGDQSYALKIDGEELRNMTDRRIVGEQFKGHEEEKKIVQVFGDSAKIDFSTLGGPFDFAFIDGCHDYAYVKSDTDNVLKVMRSGGIIMWHDYAMMEPVSRAVDEYRGKIDRMVAIEGTRIALGWVR